MLAELTVVSIYIDAVIYKTLKEKFNNDIRFVIKCQQKTMSLSKSKAVSSAMVHKEYSDKDYVSIFGRQK